MIFCVNQVLDGRLNNVIERNVLTMLKIFISR